MSVSRIGQLLDAVDQPGAGPGPGGVGVDGVHRYAGRQHAAATSSSASAWRPRGRSRTAPPPRRPGRRRATSSQVTRTRLLAGGAEQRLAAGELDHLRDPVAGRERRVGPLQQHHPRPRPRPRRRAGRRPAAPQRARPARPRPRRGRWPRPSVQRSRRSTSSRVCGSMVSTSAVQPRWASASSTDRDVDRADRAEVLGDDQVGVQPGQRALVEVVEVLAARHRRRRRTRRSRPASAPPASPRSTRSVRVRASAG